jgi:hypothetical protein
MFLRRTAIGAALIAAPLAFAAPAMAAPDTSFGCSSPCVNRTISAPSLAAADPAAPLLGAPWTTFFNTFAPWEKVFDPAGDGQGVWEKGVQAVNGGAWEKVFGEAP